MALYRAPRIYNGVDNHSKLSLPFKSHTNTNTFMPNSFSPSKDSFKIESIKSGHLNNFPFIMSTLMGTGARPGQSSERSRLVTSAQSEANTGEVSWLDLYLPEKAKLYAQLARIEKPIGTWLLAWPLYWSLALAAAPGTLPDIGTMALFSVWSVALRGAACTINDFFDRDFDSQVERCKTRPMASGAVSPAAGLAFFAFQTLLGLAPLLPMNTYTKILGALHIPFLVAYPLMKRITYWPQAFLGLAFNWGALLGWTVVKGSLDLGVVLPLFVGSFFWTLIYDTIYAHQDKEDDVKAGVKSTALFLGDSTKKWCTWFGLACIGGFALSGYNANIGSSYYAILGLVAAHLGWQIWTVDLDSPADCNNKFVSNIMLGAIMFSGILLGRFFP